jgi:hypothetical protein
MDSVKVRMRKVKTLDGVDYYITEDGRLFARGEGKGATEPELRLCRGYQVLVVCRRGKVGGEGLLYVHRLVAEAFLPNQSHCRFVIHKNGELTDNRVKNLAWSWYPQGVWDERRIQGAECCALAADTASTGAACE